MGLLVTSTYVAVAVAVEESERPLPRQAKATRRRSESIVAGSRKEYSDRVL